VWIRFAEAQGLGSSEPERHAEAPQQAQRAIECRTGVVVLFPGAVKRCQA
jgi:hypothetical protein